MKLNILYNFYFKNLRYKFTNYFYFVIPRLFNYIIFYKDSMDYFTLSFYTKKYYLEIIMFYIKYSSVTLVKILNDIIAVDLFFKKTKFKLIYNLRSFKYNLFILLNIFLKATHILGSVSYLFNSSN